MSVITLSSGDEECLLIESDEEHGMEDVHKVFILGDNSVANQACNFNECGVNEVSSEPLAYDSQEEDPLAPVFCGQTTTYFTENRSEDEITQTYTGNNIIDKNVENANFEVPVLTNINIQDYGKQAANLPTLNNRFCDKNVSGKYEELHIIDAFTKPSFSINDSKEINGDSKQSAQKQTKLELIANKILDVLANSGIATKQPVEVNKEPSTVCNNLPNIESTIRKVSQNKNQSKVKSSKQKLAETHKLSNVETTILEVSRDYGLPKDSIGLPQRKPRGRKRKLNNELKPMQPSKKYVSHLQPIFNAEQSSEETLTNNFTLTNQESANENNKREVLTSSSDMVYQNKIVIKRTIGRGRRPRYDLDKAISFDASNERLETLNLKKQTRRGRLRKDFKMLQDSNSASPQSALNSNSTVNCNEKETPAEIESGHHVTQQKTFVFHNVFEPVNVSPNKQLKKISEKECVQLANERTNALHGNVKNQDTEPSQNNKKTRGKSKNELNKVLLRKAKSTSSLLPLQINNEVLPINDSDDPADQLFNIGALSPTALISLEDRSLSSKQKEMDTLSPRETCISHSETLKIGCSENTFEEEKNNIPSIQKFNEHLSKEDSFGSYELTVETLTDLNTTQVAHIKTDFTKSFRIIFKEENEQTCTKMGDLLLLAVTETRSWKSRMGSADKFTCQNLKLEELKIASNNYINTLRNYRSNFVLLFSKVYKSIIEHKSLSQQWQALLVALFLKVFLRVISLSPELSDSILEAKYTFINLLTDYVMKTELVNKVYNLDDMTFEKNCWLVLDFMQSCYESNVETKSQTGNANTDLTLIGSNFQPTSKYSSTECNPMLEEQSKNGNVNDVTNSISNTELSIRETLNDRIPSKPQESSTNHIPVIVPNIRKEIYSRTSSCLTTKQPETKLPPQAPFQLTRDIENSASLSIINNSGVDMSKSAEPPQPEMTVPSAIKHHVTGISSHSIVPTNTSQLDDYSYCSRRENPAHEDNLGKNKREEQLNGKTSNIRNPNSGLREYFRDIEKTASLSIINNSGVDMSKSAVPPQPEMTVPSAIKHHVTGFSSHSIAPANTSQLPNYSYCSRRENPAHEDSLGKNKREEQLNGEKSNSRNPINGLREYLQYCYEKARSDEARQAIFEYDLSQNRKHPSHVQRPSVKGGNDKGTYNHLKPHPYYPPARISNVPINYSGPPLAPKNDLPYMQPYMQRPPWPYPYAQKLNYLSYMNPVNYQMYNRNTYAPSEHVNRINHNVNVSNNSFSTNAVSSNVGNYQYTNYEQRNINQADARSSYNIITSNKSIQDIQTNTGVTINNFNITSCIAPPCTDQIKITTVFPSDSSDTNKPKVPSNTNTIVMDPIAKEVLHYQP